MHHMLRRRTAERPLDEYWVTKQASCQDSEAVRLLTAEMP